MAWPWAMGPLAASGAVEKELMLREPGSALMSAGFLFMGQSKCRTKGQACVLPAPALPGPSSKGRSTPDGRGLGAQTEETRCKGTR